MHARYYARHTFSQKSQEVIASRTIMLIRLLPSKLKGSKAQRQTIIIRYLHSVYQLVKVEA
eukprot:scaffold30928_cov60-Attheya_sp.AAC.1